MFIDKDVLIYWMFIDKDKAHLSDGHISHMRQFYTGDLWQGTLSGSIAFRIFGYIEGYPSLVKRTYRL